jgi:hypothetical protein
VPEVGVTNGALSGKRRSQLGAVNFLKNAPHQSPANNHAAHSICDRSLDFGHIDCDRVLFDTPVPWFGFAAD